MAINFGTRWARALPAFHAFTGSDSTSSFRGKGKKTAWKRWNEHDEVTDAFLQLVDQPFKIFSDDCEPFVALERFVVLLYDKNTSSLL